MPNLDYDPKHPTDLLGRPIAVGDFVAWVTTYGRSPAIAVCQIECIQYKCKNPAYPQDWRFEWLDCERYRADKYQLVLRPIKSTGSVTDNKTKLVHLVKNVVKLEPIE